MSSSGRTASQADGVAAGHEGKGSRLGAGNASGDRRIDRRQVPFRRHVMGLARRRDVDRRTVQQDRARPHVGHDRAVDLQEGGAVRKHGDHDIVVRGRGGRVAGDDEALRTGRRAGSLRHVVAGDLESRRRQVACHGRPHVAEADESD